MTRHGRPGGTLRGMRKPPSDAGSRNASPRIEPWLDRDAGGVAPGSGPSSRDTGPPSPKSIPAWRRWLAAALAIGGIALLLWLRQPLSEWLWPDTRAQQLRADAAQALLAGELSRPDGRGARELYEAALALDPDRPDARDGLARVGQAALAQADIAIRAGRYPEAQRALGLARELEVPRAQVDAIAERLREHKVGDAGVDRLLAQADAARAGGRLDGAADTALPLYEQVLALQPNHTHALEGREDTLADLLQLSRQALARGALAEANELIRRVQAVDPGHVDLPDALAALSQAIDQRLSRADADLRRGRLPQALAKYADVTQLDSGNSEAARGKVRVANAFAQRSERHAADFRFDQAVAALHEARAIAADAPAVVAAEQHLARARQSRARLESAMPIAERRRRLRQLLAEAAAAESRGDLLSPPGDSAFDKVRAARALAPRDKSVIAAAARLVPAAQDCFDRALRGNRLTTAGGCLDALVALDGSDSAAVRDGRSRLAQRWIAVGDERLGAGDLPVAKQALASARALDPNAPGLRELAERVRVVDAIHE